MPIPDRLTKWKLVTYLLKEPLLHFLLLGVLIFVANDRINGNAQTDKAEIVVSLARQENLAKNFARTWQREPTKAELDALIVDFIRQEIAYREGLAMQLDSDDIVIKRRLRQKLEILAEDVASMTPPGESNLRQYFTANAEAFRRPAVLSFRQVYFNADADQQSAIREASKLLVALQQDESQVNFPDSGDPSMLPRELENVRVPELSNVFGSEFVDAILRAELNRWIGPIRSGFGIHLVRVDSRVESRMPSFDEVAERVLREWLAEQRSRAIDGMYQRMSEDYSIVIEAPATILPDADVQANR
jgi:hypothetical protein